MKRSNPDFITGKIPTKVIRRTYSSSTHDSSDGLPTGNRNFDVHQQPAAQNAYTVSDTEDTDEELLPEERNPLRFVVIGDKCNTDVNPRFGLNGEAYYMAFKNTHEINDIETVARAAFKKVLDMAFENAVRHTDLVGVQISHPCLDTEALVPFGTAKECTVDKVMRLVGDIQQSHKELTFDEEMCIKITKIRLPEGEGRTKMNAMQFEESFKLYSGGHGSTIIQIKNNDNLCLPRAIVLGKARIQYSYDKTIKYDTIRKGDARRGTMQKRLALELCEKAGIQDHGQPLGLEHMRKFQEVLVAEGFQLKVFSRDSYGQLIFNDNLQGPTQIYLLHHDNHFDVLKTPKPVTGTDFYCDYCDRGYDRIEEHDCKAFCACCKSEKPCLKDSWMECKDCNRRFMGRICFDKHKEKKVISKKVGNKEQKISKKSVCETLVCCKTCFRNVRRQDLATVKHYCGQKYCRVCKVWDVDKDHVCFIQPIKNKEGVNEDGDLLPEEKENDPDDIDAIIKEHEEADGETDKTREAHFSKYRTGVKKKETPKYIFFDFETTQETEIGENKLGPIYLHKPNYCIVRKVCALCKDFWLQKCNDCKDRSCAKCEENAPKCAVCREHKLRFLGPDCKTEFCKWFFSQQNRGCIAIAHNAKGFDAHFLLQWIIQDGGKPNIVPRGLSIMCIEAYGVKVIDSFNFLPMPLATLPKAFAEKEMKKGFFPYTFCKAENWNYTGPWPAAHEYNPTQMSAEKRKEFFEWYNQQTGKIFDFQKELREYCESDVDILLRCCMKFRDLFLEETGVEPFEVAITIASACNHVFRKKFLKPKTIGIVPPGGYRRHEKQSLVALQWLKWIVHRDKIEIQHAKNGKEKVIGGWKADGYCSATNTVYEFHGCTWHGCKKCKPNREKKIPGSSMTYEDVYQRTVTKAKVIRGMGYNLIEMWECDFYREFRNNAEMREFVEHLDILHLMNPREAFSGGRTNATKLYHKCKLDERIEYIDVCSLYPWVCKYGIFPLYHPKIITEGFDRITKDHQPYFGLIRCKVIPPRKLLHPVLPYHYDSKLNFVLCRKCLEEKMEQSCTHNDEERAITSTWVSLELDKALQLGYKVQSIYEVWHYEDKAKYDKQNDETGLFTKYINCFLKLKTQASGWPADATTETNKDDYIKEYEDKEGITLEKEKIEKNSGLRSIAKLMLNSFWGKFGQRCNMGEVAVIHEPSKFFDLVTCDENIILQVRSMGQNCVAVNYKKKEDHETALTNTNVVIASFVTAQARLKLYSYIENLQERVLYFDTDSVIFLTRPQDVYLPKTGKFLGDMTNELEEFGPGAKIVEYVSGGPKNYGYKIQLPSGEFKTKIKVKGFGLNYITAAHINFERLRRQVKKFVKEKSVDKVVVVQPEIRRTKDHNIVTLLTRKEHRVVYEKRKVLQDYSTLPWGY